MAAVKINDQRGRRERQGRGGEGGGSVLISTCKCPSVSAVAAEKDFISVLRPLWGSRVLSERHVTLIDLANLFGLPIPTQ